MPQTHTRAKLTQIFRYVQAFNQLQNPVPQDIQTQPWVLWLHDLPQHPCIMRPANTNEGSHEQEADTDATIILKVRRPVLTNAPEPPAAILPWLEQGWQDIHRQVAIDETKTPALFDDPARNKLFNEWKKKHEIWVRDELPVRATHDVFEKIYALYNLFAREAEQLELMLGDGLLHWFPQPGRGVYHPILLLRIQLTFDPQIPEFTFSETEATPELYTALLQSLPETYTINIGNIRQEFEQQQIHPLEPETNTNFYKSLIHQLSPKGFFSEQPLRLRPNDSIPMISRNPVLFLRKRTLGFSTALETILSSLPTRDDLPEVLGLLAGVEDTSHQAQKAVSSISRQLSPNGEDEEILFSKPANAEQLEIAHSLAHDGAVLVQGPPGTGKTHTIANLLGHLLAEGKSVLVTSHTAKALRVLREKVVEPLQPLCVSVLEDGNRKQMESAIEAIVDRLSTIRPGALEPAIHKLTQQRAALINQLRSLRDQLKKARNSEYQGIIVAGETHSPSDAARYVAKYQATAAWIPTPVTPGALCSLSEIELHELYQTNVTVTPADEREMVPGLPDPKALPSPVEFEQAAAECAQLMQGNLDYRSNFWNPGAHDRTVESLQAIEQKLKRAIEAVQEQVRWRLATLAAGRDGGARVQVWNDLIAKIEATNMFAAQKEPLLIEYAPTLPDGYPLDDAERIFTAIITHLEQGARLNGIRATLFHRDWKPLLEQVRINGQAPTARVHIEALHACVCLQRMRADLRGRWQRQMTTQGGPTPEALGPEPERICAQYIAQIRQCLAWYPNVWQPLEQEIQRCGLHWNQLLSEMPAHLSEFGDLQRLLGLVNTHLPPIIQAEIQRRRYRSVVAVFNTWQQRLSATTGPAAQAEVVKRLQEALQTRNTQHYRAAIDRLVTLHHCQREAEKRHQLLQKLMATAPGWAMAINKREGMHGQGQEPSNFKAAWLWRQLHDELERRSAASLEQLQERINNLSQELYRVTAELVEKKAWAAQIQRTTPIQRQALMGWKETIRKIGKGTGKRAPQLQAQARQLMATCQTAVPVWIMPLNRVVQNFNPGQNRFDVVIIDEASQADIKALAALYMGQQLVIVGDHEQVTPLAVGQKADDFTRLINEHLQDIPNAALYDGKLSIYALAQTTFPPICLREHFRCVSPIIQFSNDLSYEGKIVPLRDDSEVKLRPPTIAYRVQSSNSTTAKINPEEAQAITSLLVAASEMPAYKDATFGVISMTRDDQAILIDSYLRRYMPPQEYTQRHILCGDSAQFQGDERDVIFISVVDTPMGGGPLRMHTEDGQDDMYKKRFNVAASRARDQLWVVHSLDPSIDLKDGDIRKRLILHAQNPDTTIHTRAQQEQRVDSEFERQVLQRLIRAGYRVTTQWPVGAYRIDLVVEGNGKRLAVECDGDRWHPIEKLEEDMARQAVLERLGWRFARIRGSQFFRNPEQAMSEVFERLRALDIPPSGNAVAMETRDQDGVTLKEQVIRRAEELRRQWFEQEEARAQYINASKPTGNRQTSRAGSKTIKGGVQ